MLKLTRISFFAILLLLVLFSLPLWLRAPRVAGDASPEKHYAVIKASDVVPAQTRAPASKGSNPSFGDLQLPAMTLVDGGWYSDSGTVGQFVHPPAILRWDPARTDVDWRVETGSFTGAYQDEAERIYLVDQDSLIILDAQSGEALSRRQLAGAPVSGPDSGQLFPVGRQGDRLYLRNYALRDNLFVYDLRAGVFGEESWTVCEAGYPFDSLYLPQESSFVTFCIDFSEGMEGVLTRLSVEDGTSASVEIPALGADEYMTGNGFALGPGELAYVVDSDAGALVEIDIQTMRILRQADYRQELEGTGWLPGVVSRLLELAASPARAKRWMSQPVVSPDGRYLVVDGGFAAGGGATTNAWLIDLESLAPVQEIELPGSPQAFHFADDSLLYILLQTESPGDSRAVAFDLDSQVSLTLNVPASGMVLRFLP